MSATPTRALDARGVAEAVSGVRGVASSRVVRRRGQEQVRLRLREGADAAQVAAAVRSRLAGEDAVIDLRGADGRTDGSTHDRTDGRSDDRAGPTADDRGDEPSSPEDGASTGGPPTPAPPSTPNTPRRDAPLVVVEAAPHQEPAAGQDAPARLALVRTRVGVQGWAAVAEVALADGDVLHVGSAEAATTAAGSRRALAAAAAQALESAGAGALRIEVEGVQVEPVAGRAAAVVVLSVVSARGAEQLIGCALVGDDPGRAVVNAVLSAANRRLELAMAERGGA